MSRRKITECRRAVFVAKIYKDAEWNEYRVTLSHIDDPQNVLSTYHSDDLQDARATANTILNEMAAEWWQGENDVAGNSDCTLVELRLPKGDIKNLIEAAVATMFDLERMIKKTEGFTDLKATLVGERVRLSAAVGRLKRSAGMP